MKFYSLFGLALSAPALEYESEKNATVTETPKVKGPNLG